MKTTLTTEPVQTRARHSWLWPALLTISAIAAAVFTFANLSSPLRPVIIFWFLLVCPGMAFVRLLRLRDIVAEWSLAIMASLAADALIAGTMAYTGAWSPERGLGVLVVLTLAGVMFQVAQHFGERYLAPD
jgi:hypothetical protein